MWIIPNNMSENTIVNFIQVQNIVVSLKEILIIVDKWFRCAGIRFKVEPSQHPNINAERIYSLSQRTNNLLNWVYILIKVDLVQLCSLSIWLWLSDTKWLHGISILSLRFLQVFTFNFRWLKYLIKNLFFDPLNNYFYIKYYTNGNDGLSNYEIR